MLRAGQNMMLGTIWIGAIFLAACGDGQGGRMDHPLGRQLTEQIIASCEQGLTYQKTVIDRQKSPPSREDSVFSPVPKVVVGEAEDGQDSTTYLLLRDLAYAVERYYQDPYLVENFIIESHGDTTIAQVKPNLSKEVDLQQQKVLYQSDGEQLAYLSTYLRKSSWLYAMDIDMNIHFDEAGRYTQHRLEVITQVPMLGKTFEAVIEGKGTY